MGTEMRDKQSIINQASGVKMLFDAKLQEFQALNFMGVPQQACDHARLEAHTLLDTYLDQCVALGDVIRKEAGA